MCKEFCGDRGFLWRSVGLGDVVGGETNHRPHSKDFPCSTHQCEVRFKMALGIFFGDHVFCSKGCFDEWWKINEAR